MLDNTNPLIELRDVKKHFGSKKILQGIDLKVNKGESLVIIGGSGTGKSVTLKCILGLLKPTSGEILYDGQRIDHLSLRKREDVNSKIGMLFQGGALFDSLSIWENISFGALAKKQVTQSTAKKLAIECLEKVGLDPLVANSYPSELSGGMQKRAGLARAIATNPEVILFDEPTTGLDPIMANVINDLIISVTKDLGSSAITITHDMNSALKIADRVAMLWDGRIIWQGTSQDVENTDNPYIQQFYQGCADGPIDWAKKKF